MVVAWLTIGSRIDVIWCYIVLDGEGMSSEPKDLLESVEQEQIVEVAVEKERGASMVEYALLVALIAIIAIVAVRTVGQQVSENFSQIQSELARANS